MIANSQHFTYIGYTQSPGNAPTFYFDEGRYTQVHNNLLNIGWHPRKGANYHYGNIHSQAVASLNGIRAEIRRLRGLDDSFLVRLELRYYLWRKRSFITDFRGGMITEISPDTQLPDPNSRLLECYQVGVNWATHTSRSRLVRVGDPGFNVAFSEAAAKAVLAAPAAQLAANEH